MRRVAPFVPLVILVALTISSAWVSAAHRPGGLAPIVPRPGVIRPVDSWSRIATVPAQPGLWKCATQNDGRTVGDGAVVAVSWEGWTITLAYVSQFRDASQPWGHPTAQSVALSQDGGEQIPWADLGPNQGPDGADGLNFILAGVCLARFPGSESPIGLLFYEIPGSAGCCSVVRAVVPTSGQAVAVVDVGRYLPGPTQLQNVAGTAAISTGDISFTGAFTDDADSAWPLLLFTFEGGAFVDVTARYPGSARADATEKWSWFEEAHQQGRLVQGVLAAWTADECNAGAGSEAWSTLESLARQGVIAPGLYGNSLSGPAYLAGLGPFLHTHGYCATEPLNHSS